MRCVSISNELKVSQWPDGKELYYYKSRSGDSLPINSVSWGKNGTWLLMCQSYGSAEIISLGEEAKRLFTIQNVKNTTCAAFQNSMNRRVSIGTLTGQLVTYDLKSKCIKQQFPMQQSSFFKIEHSINDTHLLGGCKDGRVYIYRMNTGNQIAALMVPKSPTLTNFRCHPGKSNIVGLCSEKGVVAVWDYNVEKPIASYEGHRAFVSDVLLRNDNVLSIGADRRFSSFDYRTKNCILEHSFSNSPTAFDLHNDDVSLAIGFTNGQVCGFDLRSMKQTTQVIAKHTSRINQISFDTCSGTCSITLVAEGLTTDSIQNDSEQQSENFSAIYCDVPVRNADSVNANSPSITNQTDSFMAALSINSDTGGKLDDSATRAGGDRVRRRLGPVQDLKNSFASPMVEKVVEEPQLEAACGDVQTEEPHNSNPIANIRKSAEFLKVGSTPVNTNSPSLSPIFPLGGHERQVGMINKEEIRSMLREIVQEEVGELREEMKNQMHDLKMNTRQHLFALQWMVNKLSVDVEESIERLRQNSFNSEEQF